MTMTMEVINPPERKRQSPAARTEAKTLMEVISRAANDPDTNVEKVERLVGLYERITERQSEQAFNAAMSAAQMEMPQVVRDTDNDQTKSKYARLETISAAMTPVITKHGFGLSFGTDEAKVPNHYGITCLASHDAGFKRIYRADIPIDIAGMKGTQNKTATHAFGSTMSYGRRYLKLMIFDVQLKNEDDDGQAAGSGPVITEQQAHELNLLLTATKSNMPSFLEHFGISAVPDLPAARLGEAMRLVEEKARRAAAEAAAKAAAAEAAAAAAEASK